MNKYSIKLFKDTHLIVILIALVILLFAILDCRILLLQKSMDDLLTQDMQIRQDIERITTEQPIVEENTDETEKVAIKRNYDLIERVVAAEARGDTLEGMMAVAQTIKDRGDIWEMDYNDVVLQNGQYASPYQGEISDDVKLAVSRVFENGERVCEEPMTHFYAGATPYWAKDKVSRGSCGSKAHTFMY